MVLQKIPTFDDVKDWAQNQGWITESEAPVQSVDSKTGDVTLNYADQNHSNRHENGGSDELEASNLSLAGSSSQYLSGSGWTTPESGLEPGDFVSDSGSFNASTTNTVGTTTVDFNTNFDAISGANIGVEVDEPTNPDKNQPDGWVASISTDSMTIEYTTSFDGASVNWYVWGVNQ